MTLFDVSYFVTFVGCGLGAYLGWTGIDRSNRWFVRLDQKLLTDLSRRQTQSGLKLEP